MSNALTRPLAYAVLTPQGEVAWVTRDAAAAQAHEGEGWTVRPLYAHPPAAPVPPVVAVTDEMVERAAKALHASVYPTGYAWEDEEPNWKRLVRNRARDCITAALRPETRGSDA